MSLHKETKPNKNISVQASDIQVLFFSYTYFFESLTMN